MILLLLLGSKAETVKPTRFNDEKSLRLSENCLEKLIDGNLHKLVLELCDYINIYIIMRNVFSIAKLSSS